MLIACGSSNNHATTAANIIAQPVACRTENRSPLSHNTPPPHHPTNHQHATNTHADSSSLAVASSQLGQKFSTTATSNHQQELDVTYSSFLDKAETQLSRT